MRKKKEKRKEQRNGLRRIERLPKVAVGRPRGPRLRKKQTPGAAELTVNSFGAFVEFTSVATYGVF